MLGRDRDRLAQPERVGLVDTGVHPPALALVGDHDHRLAGAAHQIGEGAVGGQEPGTGVDHEQHRVGGFHRGGGLRLHAAGEARGRGFVETGGVDHREVEIADMGAARAAVAGDAGLVVDQRETLANEAVEQCRFADIGPADDRDGEAHDGARGATVTAPAG